MADSTPEPDSTPGPLGLVTAPRLPPDAYPELRALSFAFSSRGDRVPARLLLPASGTGDDESGTRDGRGPYPVVLLQHGAGGSKESAYLDAAAGPWARRGLAVAAFDFPLHGERADAKLSQLLLADFARASALGGTGEVPGLGLAEEFARQARSDCAQALHALAAMPAIDPTRIGYAGFSLGAILGVGFCATDPRPRAVALALGGGGIGPAQLDPTQQAGAIAPRPLLMVNATRDETVPRAATEALFAAAREPKELLWFEGTHNSLPGAALKAMWRFFERHLPV